MRWLAIAALGACSFTPGSYRADGGDHGGEDVLGIDVALDDTLLPDPDAAIDAPPPSPARVRPIDIVDAQVDGGPHANFPLLVALTADWLVPVSAGGEVANDDGADIYFTADAAGTMKLAHDVEAYTPATGTLLAWVKVPSLAADTVIYIHYGDPAITTSQAMRVQTWSAGYELVSHMDGSGDATGKSTTIGSVNLSNATGQIGAARSFNGSDSNATFGSATAIDNIWSGGGTAEAWIRATTFGEGSRARIFDKGEDAGWALLVDNYNATSSISFIHGANNRHGYWAATSNSITVNTWHHVVVIYNKGSTMQEPTFYIDGEPRGTNVGDSPLGTIVNDGAAVLYAGNNPQGNRTFNGILDELRLSSVTRSAQWIRTQFRNQSAPSTFYTVGNPL